MAVGLFFVFLKLGRKLRFWRVVTRWQSSWMTRETWCVALVYGSLMASWAWPAAVWDVFMAAGGVGFLWCQAKILHSSRGIPAWRHESVPALLTLTGLLEGAGLLTLTLVLWRMTGMNAGEMAVSSAVMQACGAAMAACAVAMAVLWPRYAAAVQEETAGRLQTLTRWIGLTGHWPALLAGMMMLLQPANPLVHVVALTASVAVVATGALLKFQLVVRAALFQGTRIPSSSGSIWKASPTAITP
jgi:phenylacetyl-CoA:acceptor oxidoreductase subunit 2